MYPPVVKKYLVITIAEVCYNFVVNHLVMIFLLDTVSSVVTACLDRLASKHKDIPTVAVSHQLCLKWGMCWFICLCNVYKIH